MFHQTHDSMKEKTSVTQKNDTNSTGKAKKKQTSVLNSRNRPNIEFEKLEKTGLMKTIFVHSLEKQYANVFDEVIKSKHLLPEKKQQTKKENNKICKKMDQL